MQIQVGLIGRDGAHGGALAGIDRMTSPAVHRVPVGEGHRDAGDADRFEHLAGFNAERLGSATKRVFQAVMRKAGAGERLSPAEQRAKRRQRDGSILDSLNGSLSRLKVQAGAADKVKLDDYTENVREIERRLQIAMKASTVAPT